MSRSDSASSPKKPVWVAGRVDRVEQFKLLADPQRLQVLALCAEEELSVGELASLLEDSQPQVSRKVAPLREAGLLGARKDGTRTWLRTELPDGDLVLAEALSDGRRRCQQAGSLARLPKLVAAREESSRAFFEQGSMEEGAARPGELPAPAHLAHLAALSPLLPGRDLAVDVGTGEGVLLDILAPLYGRVLAVDRSPAQLARCAVRVAQRGFHHVSLLQASHDDVSLVQRVDAAGGADLVFAARALHHVSRPGAAVAAFARLLRRGGHLVLLDYEPHDDDKMRETQGDVWLGFSSQELVAHCEAAGLGCVGTLTIPPVLHRDGPDAHLAWHAVVAQKPPACGPNTGAVPV